MAAWIVASVAVQDWSVKGASGSWKAVFDEAGWKRTLGFRSGANWFGCSMRCLSPTPQDSGTLTTLNWVSPLRRTWRRRRRLVGVASTSPPPKVEDAGNGESTLFLPTAMARGNAVMVTWAVCSRKGESLMLGNRESNGCS